MPLKTDFQQDDERQRLADDVLEELAAWNPRDRIRAFKSWLAGSLSLVHLHVLTILETDGPESMGRLADALDVSVASATGIVDRMERHLLVERRPDPDDRRLVVVHLLDAGTDVFRQLAEHRRQSLTRLLGRLTDAELRALLIGIRALRAAREADAAHAPGADAPGADAPGSAPALGSDEASDSSRARQPGATTGEPAARAAGSTAHETSAAQSTAHSAAS